MEVVETEGETLSPEEFNNAQGWVVAHQRRREAKDKANAELATNAGGASKEAPRKLHDFLHRRPAPKEPQLPEDDYKVVIRPGGGLDLTRQSVALIRDGVLRAAKIQPDIAGEDTLRINMRQNTIMMSTPSLANAKDYSNIKDIKVHKQSYATAAYITAPENTSKGVIHGIPTYDNQEDIEKSLVNQRNPTILQARRMGLTDSVVIVFEGSFVPYFVYYRGAEYRLGGNSTQQEIQRRKMAVSARTKESDAEIAPTRSHDSPKGPEKIPNTDPDQHPDQGPHLNTDPDHGPDPRQEQGRHLRENPKRVLTAVGAAGQR
ncbi:hypothetical protein MTO96_037702 [Rhipicephalus appendiculatus]